MLPLQALCFKLKQLSMIKQVCIQPETNSYVSERTINKHRTVTHLAINFNIRLQCEITMICPKGFFSIMKLNFKMHDLFFQVL